MNWLASSNLNDQNGIEFIRSQRTCDINGALYEIKLLIFFLLDGMIKKKRGEIKNFYIATNMEKAGGFDDVVYKYDYYQTNGRLKTKIIFLQAKHKIKTMKKETLLSQDPNDLALRKYLSSYWKIKEQFKSPSENEPIFSNNIEDCEFILFTTANYSRAENDDILIRQEIRPNDDQIFNFEENYFYKLNTSDERVLAALKTSFVYDTLIRELSRSILKTPPHIEFGNVKDFQFFLTEDIIERIENKEGKVKLKERFLDDNNTQFINSLLQEIKKHENYQNKPDEDIKKDLRNIEINLNSKFWKSENYPLRLPLPPKEFIEADVSEFARKLKIFSNQLNVGKLEDEIKDRIKQEYKVDKRVIDNVYLEIENKVKNWWQEGHHFLTETNMIIHEAIRTCVRFEIRKHAKPWVERRKELENLHKSLQNKTNNGESQIVVITGPGGVGKSELVRKYIKDHDKDYDNNMIWIYAEKYSTLVESFRKLAERLKIGTEDEEKKQKEVKKIVEEVYEYFVERKRKSLFVFDNAGICETVFNADDSLVTFLPRGLSKPNIIITSRNQNWSREIAKISLNVFTEEEALDFITNSCKDYEDDMKKLAKKLDYLPLALKQAVAYINEENNRIQQFAREEFMIKNYLEKYEELAKSQRQKALSDSVVDCYKITYSVTINQIKQRHFGKQAEEIINLLAYMSPDNIPARGLFATLIRDSETLGGTAKLLNQYSIANLESGLFNIHRVVQDVIRNQLKKQKKEKKVLGKLMGLLLLHIGSIQNTTHAVTAWSHAKNHRELVRLFSRLPVYITNKLVECMRNEEALLFGSESIKLLKKVLGSKNEDFLKIMNSLGVVHMSCEKFDEAMNIYRTLSNKHSKTLNGTNHNTLRAETNRSEKLPKKYEDVLKKQVTVYEKQKNFFFPLNTKTLISKYYIGGIYEKLDDFESALEFYKQILSKFESLYNEGNNAIDMETVYEYILKCRNSIASILTRQSLYGEALKLYEKSYSDGIKNLKENHDDTLSTLDGKGLVYRKSGKLKKALKCYEEVLAKKRARYPRQNHPDVLRAENNIAGILLDLKEVEPEKSYQRALNMYKNLYKKQRKQLGIDHPDTLATLHNIGLSYKYLGDNGLALAYFKYVLPKKKMKLGIEHVETLETRVKIAQIYKEEGNSEKARSIYSKLDLISDRLKTSDK